MDEIIQVAGRMAAARTCWSVLHSLAGVAKPDSRHGRVRASWLQRTIAGAQASLETFDLLLRPRRYLVLKAGSHRSTGAVLAVGPPWLASTVVVVLPLMLMAFVLLLRVPLSRVLEARPHSAALLAILPTMTVVGALWSWWSRRRGRYRGVGVYADPEDRGNDLVGSLVAVLRAHPDVSQVVLRPQNETVRELYAHAGAVVVGRRPRRRAPKMVFRAGSTEG